MDIKFLNELRNHLGIESECAGEIDSKYNGSEVAEELYALDDIENTDIAVESLFDAMTSAGLEYQTVALESSGLSINEFANFADSLGTESIKNMVKRGYYNTVILLKKAIQKLWKLVMAVVDFFYVCDGRWKSYSKLFKKYNQRLNKTSSDLTEKGEDKEYSLRDISAIQAFCTALIGGWQTAKEGITIPGAGNIQPLEMVRVVTRGMGGAITGLIRATSKGDSRTVTDSIFNPLNAIISTFGGTALTGQDYTDLNNAVTALMGDETSAERMDTATDAVIRVYNQYQENAKERIKEDLQERKELWAETREYRPLEARRVVSTAGYQLEQLTRRNMNWVKFMKRVSKDIDRAIDRVSRQNTEADDQSTQANTNNTRSLKSNGLMLLGILAEVMVGVKYAANEYVRLANHGLQVVLADMAKVLSGETRVNG